MKRFRLMAVGMMLTACLGVSLPQTVFAEGKISKRPVTKTVDVKLQRGLLIGQLVDTQGKQLQSASVVIMRHDAEVARTKTDKYGRFAVKGLPNGVYSVVTANARSSIRVWTEELAPPTAVKGALLVDGQAVRGQLSAAAGGAAAGGSIATAAAVTGVVAASVVVGGVVDVGLDFADGS